MSDSEDALIEARARALGLDKALAAHREDVLAAARRAAAQAAQIGGPEDPRAEPWPAMRVEAPR